MQFIWLPALIWTILFLATDAKSTVSAVLHSKWRQTSLFAEASELITKIEKEKFWKFIDILADQSSQIYNNQETDLTQYNHLVNISSSLLTNTELRLLKLSLSLHAQSAVMAFHQQTARQLLKISQSSNGCRSVVYLNGESFCTIDALNDTLNSLHGGEDVPDDQSPMVFHFDHHHSSYSLSKKPFAILYGDLGSEEFAGFHKLLKSTGSVRYVFRHFNVEQHFAVDDGQRIRLSGYGVELAIKSTEYKAQDDSPDEGGAKQADGQENQLKAMENEGSLAGFKFAHLVSIHPHLKEDLVKFRKHLLDADKELVPLKAWELQDISFQVAQHVLSQPADKQLAVLTDSSQNFPSLAKSFSRLDVDNNLRSEIDSNKAYFEQLGLRSGDNAVFVNGQLIDFDQHDVYTLFDKILDELGVMGSIGSFGLDSGHVRRLLDLPLRDNGAGDFALDVRSDAVRWLNDLENDSRYASWPASVQELLRPVFMSVLRYVRRNFFNLVFVVDPARPEAKNLLQTAEAFITHDVPLRMGLVFVTTRLADKSGQNDASLAMLRAFNYVAGTKKQNSLQKALGFLTDVYETNDGSSAVTVADVLKAFELRFPNVDIQSVFGHQGTHQYDTGRFESLDFFDSTGLDTVPQVLVNGVPLPTNDIGPDSLEESILSVVVKQTQSLQQDVYSGRISDDSDVFEYIMEQPNVMPRLNGKITSFSFGSFLEFETVRRCDSNVYTEIKPLLDCYRNGLIGVAEFTDGFLSNQQLVRYYFKSDEFKETVKPVTILVVADMESPEGRRNLMRGLKYLKSTNYVRLGVVFNPSQLDFADQPVSKAIYVALQVLSNTHSKQFSLKLLKEDTIESLKDGSKGMKDVEVHGMNTKEFYDGLNEVSLDFLRVHQLFCRDVLKLAGGQSALIVNGKVISTKGPLPLEEADYRLADKFFTSAAGGGLLKSFLEDKMSSEMSKKLFPDPTWAPRQRQDIHMRLSSILVPYLNLKSPARRFSIDYRGDLFSAVKLAPSFPGEPLFEIVAIVDPVTRDAQRIAPILSVLRQVVNVELKLFFNCQEKLSELPLKNYYRFVLHPELQFQADSLSAGPMAQFTGLPQKSLLTMNMQPPESWLVESVNSRYDLDNILLSEVESGNVHADFELEYLLIEGHCSDAVSGQPPRGLQFTLGTKQNPVMVDTIVMANLGYFQLKANPGVWHLRLRDGRSADIYNIVSHELSDSPIDGNLNDEIIVTLSNLKSRFLKVKVSKKPDKKQMNLLSDEDDTQNQEEEPGSLWESVSSAFGSGSGKTTSGSYNDTLNIFSVASGHLYERFLRIMMLSVSKHTKQPVKFWLLQNYLSPTFKKFLPYYAAEHGFEYQLVQYKWPRWLHQQTEKQRIIWGYKILFLDVLFPLDVHKVAYVDADQVVRTDLQELFDLDLHGAPYGYTPFCDSRPEMDGYRFWKGGYWEAHLGKRKYHISALYIIDLKQFRRVAAGDRLRGQYQGLSQDPNSLANLDQDLPNNMIHQVPIHSLPQEWLWCETWCSNEDKPKAKTIDLCNNPQTKEPKLSAAMRIIPEWKDYDDEIRRTWEKVFGVAKTTSSSQTSGSNTADDTSSSSSSSSPPSNGFPKKTEL